jgi:predicted alpha/beta superfamily hydrolase
MMKKTLIFFLLAIILKAGGQNFQLFTGNQLNFYSQVVDDTFNIDIQLPENYFLANDSIAFPLIILLDSQNEFTYEYNLLSIEMLVFHSQIPQPIVVGIPFNIRNRLSLTALENFFGIEGKIENTTRFIFDELLPHLKIEYNAGSPVLIFGHSRSGFLTSYFMINRSNDFDVAGSFSGFFEKGFDLNEIEGFLKKQNSSSKPFNYYFSAGTNTHEESLYLADYKQLDAFLSNTAIPENFDWHFIKNPNSNHITNYNLSVPKVLIHYFGEYNKLLDDWLFQKLKSNLPVNPLETLISDFDELSYHYQAQINPDFVHIYSIASALINENPEAALEIFIYGNSFYPYEHELDYDIISLMLDLGQNNRAKEWLQKSLHNINRNQNLAEDQKETIRTSLWQLIAEE